MSKTKDISQPSLSVIILREIFYFSSLTLLLFIILEIIFPYIVLAYFNLNYLVALVIISGLIKLGLKQASSGAN
ncbi:MAG: hypothetical protein NTX66_01120 [Candidatus Falkowbacteria bacterium]|nr:hypothetical protein [Candidatus Falkowbacteria bacterium]